MKAIIMAAGIGTRLKKKFGNMPKCLTDIGGETIVRRMVRLLHERGIKDISLVLGYQDHLVRAHLGSRWKVHYYSNPFFSITNSICSLWFARNELDGQQDAIILNGDLFEPGLLEQVMSAKEDAVMFADPRRVEEGDYRFAYTDGLLRRYGKDLPAEMANGEYVGIAKLDRGTVAAFRTRLEQLIALQQFGLWWEDALYRLSADGMPIHIHEITEHFWAELDYLEDYERTQQFLKSSAEKAANAA